MSLAKYVYLTAFVVAQFLTHLAQGAEPGKPNPVSGLRTDIEFAKVGDVSLTLDVFVPPGEGPFPTCILVHGGGFVRGDKQTFIKPLFEPLGKAGFTWFSINYRLAPAHRWPACAEDVAEAIRWVRLHAKEYRVDPERIALIGESAGGHLVSWVGAEAKGDTAVAAVVPFYAPHDLELQVDKRQALGPSMTALLGLTELNDDARKVLRAASPTTKIHAGMPPYLLIHGDADEQVPYEQSPRFQKQMRAADNVCDLVTIAGGAHGMGKWAEMGSDYQAQLIAWLRKTMKQFLPWTVSMNIAGVVTVALILGAADSPWREVAPGLWRQACQPAAYVLIDGREAIAIGAPAELDLDSLEKRQQCRVETVLLTHHHRDAVAAAARLIHERRTVRASRAAEPWLSPAGAGRYWDDSLLEIPAEAAPPLFHRRWAKWQYLVVSEGIEGLACDLADGDVVRCGKWKITAVATPGHSPDHTSYLTVRDDRPDHIVLCGDAFFREGKLWTPYTTDWHHQNADGLTAAAESLRRIAALAPTWLCPEHGDPIHERIDAQLSATALSVRRAAVAKSYEQFLRSTDHNLPPPDFLAPDQVGSATPDGNTKSWTKVSPHLFLSGNTYAIASRDGPALLVDPYHRGLPQRLEELQANHRVGPVEAMLVSHAHNDHYTGVFAFEPADRPPVWTLDRIARAIESPDRLRAPYVDPRPVKVTRHLQDGETITWREYRLKIHHQPGQTDLAMGVETEIDGHRVLFTGDNFYRADQYSGSGGWSGHNRGLPGGYVRSLERILEIKPEWILAEHGGAFAFRQDDFAARLAWAREAAAAADALSPSGDCRRDWNPHLASIEPAIVRANPGEVCKLNLVAEEPLGETREFWVRLSANRVIANPETISPIAMENGQGPLELKIRADAPAGRYVIPVEIGPIGSLSLSIDCVLVVVVR